MPRIAIPPAALTRGPFAITDARLAGLDRWHLRSPMWRRLSRGMYVLADLPQTPMSALAAVRLRVPEEGVFSGLTAAWLAGIDAPPCDPVEVTVPPGRGVSTRAGVRVRRAVLFDGDVVNLRGFPATSVARTVADLSRWLTLTEAVVVADAALHSRKSSMAQLASWAEAHNGHPGVRRLRQVIEHAEPKAGSPMETRLRMLLVLGGLPRPKAQVPIYDSNGNFVGRPDLYYEDARLAIEYDGAIHRTSLAEDNRRQNKLVNAGVRLLRFTAADVHKPTSVVAQVRAALYSP